MIDVVVIGGGMAGLAAADRLAATGAQVTLVEAADRLGGNVYTTSFAGHPLDLGAEALVRRDKTAIELCGELGLADELVIPASRRAFVSTARGLRPLPSGAIGRMPGGLAELLGSCLLSPRGLARCGWDLIAPSREPDHDVAIGELVRSRLGHEVLERIVDPLLGSVHAGQCDTLSARALAPQLVAALGTGKGIVRGLRSAGPPPDGPAFATLRTGLGSLVAALADRAKARGVTVRLGAAATEVDAPRAGRVSVLRRGGETLDASACVIAAPAAAAASMVARAAPAAASDLIRIVHARAAVVALAYPAEALAELPAGTGFVSAGGGRLVRACTWSSSKWDHLRGDPAIVKAFVGRAGAPPPDVGDLELAAAVHRELDAVLGLRHAPVEQRVHRFDAAIPQYSVGHLDRVGRIEAALPAHVVVAGGSYRGAGISACLRSGRAAADHVLRQLGVNADHHAVDLPAKSLG